MHNASVSCSNSWGGPCVLTGATGLKDLLINTHPSSLFLNGPHSASLPAALSTALKRWSILQPLVLKRPLHYCGRLLFSSRGKGASHLSPSLSVLTIFFFLVFTPISTLRCSLVHRFIFLHPPFFHL